MMNYTSTQLYQETDKYIEKFPIARTWIQKRYIPKGCVGFAAISLLKEVGMFVF